LFICLSEAQRFSAIYGSVKLTLLCFVGISALPAADDGNQICEINCRETAVCSLDWQAGLVDTASVVSPLTTPTLRWLSGLVDRSV